MKAGVVVSSIVVLLAGISGVLVVNQIGGSSEDEIVNQTGEERLDCDYIDVIDFDEPLAESAKKDAREPRAIADEFVGKRTPTATKNRVKSDPEVQVKQARAAGERSEAQVVYRNAKKLPEIRISLAKPAGEGWRLTRSEACPAEPVVNNSRVVKRDPDEAKKQEELRRTAQPKTAGPEE